MQQMRFRAFGWALLLGSLVLGAGCAGDETTVFPDGLDPLESVNKAQAPAPAAGDPYPQKINMVSGSNDQYDWVHARAYVHAPLAKTWAAVHDAMVTTDFTLSKHSYDFNVEPQYPISYVIHYEVDDLVTVNFDVTWRHGVATGTADAPQVTAGRWQKTWGTTYIRLLQGSVVGRKVDDNTTLIELIQHLDATDAGTDTITKWFNNYFNQILASVAKS
jgi:hypothetical protein